MRSPAPKGKFTKLQTEDLDDEEIELVNGNGTLQDWNDKMQSAALIPARTNSNDNRASFQHVDNVLEQSYMAAHRSHTWRSEWASYLSRNPSPYFNWISIGCTALALFFFIMLVLNYTDNNMASSYVPPACPLSPPCTCPSLNCTQCAYADMGNVTTPPAGSDITAPENPEGLDFGRHVDWEGQPRVAQGSRGVVAADHGRCSRLALSILQSDGNAVDAAVTLSLCQGLMNPGASGLGGGHFAVIRTPDGHAEVINAREVAPAAANQTMFVGQAEAALEGGLAVAVPLELQGLYEAHKRHGTLLWKQVVDPVVSIARDGFPTHPYLAQQLNSSYDKLMRHPAARSAFLLQDEDGSWRPPRVNETCCTRPVLAKFLEDVAANGPGVLYNGPYTQGFVADVQAAGGIITQADMASAQVAIEQPITAQVLGMEIVLPPPPSSAVVLVPALNVLAGYQLPLTAAGLLKWHRIVEAMKHAYAIRLHLGDPGPAQGPADTSGAPAPPRGLQETLKTIPTAAQAVGQGSDYGSQYDQYSQQQDSSDSGYAQYDDSKDNGGDQGVEQYGDAQGESYGDAADQQGYGDQTSDTQQQEPQPPSDYYDQQAAPGSSEASDAEEQSYTTKAEEVHAYDDPQQQQQQQQETGESEQEQQAEQSQQQQQVQESEQQQQQNPEDQGQGDLGYYEQQHDQQDAEQAGDYGSSSGDTESQESSDSTPSGGSQDSGDTTPSDSSEQGEQTVTAQEEDSSAAEASTEGQGDGGLGLDLTELLDTIVTKEFADKLRELTSDQSVSDFGMYGGPFNALAADGAPPDDHGTSHMSVVDKHGTAVVITSTINTAFGSGVVSQSTGLLLNNEMDDFSSPSHHNVYGLPPSKANFIVPGKRPLSSMSPVLLVQNGKLRATVGGSGGPLILSAVLQTIVRTMQLGVDPFNAVAGARVHDQLTNMTYLEDWAAGNTVFKLQQAVWTDLEARGHNVSSAAFGAVVQLVLRNPDDDTLTGVSDPRKDGAPAAY